MRQNLVLNFLIPLSVIEASNSRIVTPAVLIFIYFFYTLSGTFTHMLSGTHTE